MKERLLTTAAALSQPPETAARAFSMKRDQMASLGNQAMAERHDLKKLVGEGNQQMAEDNNRNFARFMESLFMEFHPEVLVETVLWVFRSYRSHGFQTPYWAANLNIWVDMIKKELPEEHFKSLYPFYNWLIINIPIFVKLTDDAVDGSSGDHVPAH